jgi:TRAP-type C4-dicarboxylate transport system permease small subunit
MDEMMRTLANWWGNFFLRKICHPLAMALFIAGTALAILEVIRRYVFGVSFVWQQDFVVVAVLCGTTVYFAVTQWNHAHIAVTAIGELLTRNESPRRIRAVQIMTAVGDAWTAVFLALLLIWGIPLTAKYQVLGITTPSQSFPFWPFWIVFLIGLGMYSVTSLIHAYLGLRGIPAPQPPEDTSE